MRRTWFLILFGLLCQAQNPFYVRMFEDAHRAMAEKNWPLAATYLEIAAFGFLDQDEPFVQALVEVSYTYYQLNDRQKLDETLFRIRSYFGENFEKPVQVHQEVWSTFEVLLAGNPELVPLLKTDNPTIIENYLVTHPNELKLWDRLLELANTRERWDRSYKRIMAQNLPEVWASALRVAHQKGYKRNGKTLAESLIRQNSNHSLANEYLGGLACEAKDWARAESYFSKVQKWVFPESESNRALLKQQKQTKAAPIAEPESDRGLRAQKIKDLLAANDLKGATEALRVFGQENPSDAHYMELYAEYCYRKQDDQLLIDSLGTLQTRTPPIQYFLARSHARLGHDQLAFDLLNELNAQQFPDVEALKTDIKQRLQKKNSGLLEEKTQLARQLSGKKEQAQWQRYIYVLMELNDWTEAAQELQAYRTVFGGLAANYYKARIDLNDGLFEKAGLQFSELANAGFQEMDTFYYGGVAFFMAKNYPTADYMFQRALKTQTEHEKQIRAYQEQIHLITPQ